MIVFGMRIIVVTVETILTNHVIFLNKKEKIVAAIYGICGITNFIMKYLLIKFNYFNAASAIFTTMLAEILIIILNVYYIKKYLKLKLEVFKSKNLKYLVFSFLFFPIGSILRKFEFHYMIYSIITFISCSGVYFILLLITKDRCVKEILEKININKFLRRE